MSNCPLFIRGAGVLPPLANNDHCIIHLKVLFKVDPPKCFRIQVWDLSAADVEGCNNYLNNFNFNNFFTNQYCVNEICDQLTSSILAAAEQFIPTRSITVRPSVLL